MPQNGYPITMLLQKQREQEYEVHLQYNHFNKEKKSEAIILQNAKTNEIVKNRINCTFEIRIIKER